MVAITVVVVAELAAVDRHGSSSSVCSSRCTNIELTWLPRSEPISRDGRMPATNIAAITSHYYCRYTGGL